MILPFSPKVERDKTVATKESGSERSSEWWNSNEVKCMTGGCVPLFGASWTNTDKSKND